MKLIPGAKGFEGFLTTNLKFCKIDNLIKKIILLLLENTFLSFMNYAIYFIKNINQKSKRVYKKLNLRKL